MGFVCGERGIRTPGSVKINSFQDYRIRPLCHLSSGAAKQINLINFARAAKVKIFLIQQQPFYNL